MKTKARQKAESNKINLKDWKKLIIKKSQIKKSVDSQKILHQMRYGKPIFS